MVEEGDASTVYSRLDSSGIIHSPNYGNTFSNKIGGTKLIIAQLPDRFWINIVYDPSPPYGVPNGCPDIPFYIYKSDSSENEKLRLRCGSDYYNKPGLTSTLRIVDAIISDTKQLILRIQQRENITAFKLHYSSKLRK